MADRLSKERRSANMSRIKGKNTLLEMRFRKQLYQLGIRYKLDYKLFGKPDLTIPSKKIVIFIHGCFWHQHKNCKLSYMPKTNVDFWKKKLEGNVNRDKNVSNVLIKDGWKVIEVWECDIEERIDNTVLKVANTIKQI